MPLGIVLLASAFFAASLAGMIALWAVWPRNANTSPLAALFAFTWSSIYLLAGIFTWRRSHLAPIAFLAAIGLLLFPASFLFPGSPSLLPSMIVLAPVAFFGHRYLRKAMV